MMTGGRREGAGRKPGSVNKISQHAREEAAKTGELPHEFLLRVARGEKIDDHSPEFAERVDAAKAAAPYFAPRFSATTVDARLNSDHTDENPGGMSDAELLACVRNRSKGVREMTDGELAAQIAFLELQMKSAPAAE